MAIKPKQTSSAIVNFNRTANAINELQTRIPSAKPQYTANGIVPVIRDIPDEYRPPFSLKIGKYNGSDVIMAKRGAIRYTCTLIGMGFHFGYKNETRNLKEGMYEYPYYGFKILGTTDVISRGIIVLENTEFETEKYSDWVILDYAQAAPEPSPRGDSYFRYRLEYAITYNPIVYVDYNEEYTEDPDNYPTAHFALSLRGENDSERALWSKGGPQRQRQVGIPLSYLDTSDYEHPYRDYGSNIHENLVCYGDFLDLGSEYNRLDELMNAEYMGCSISGVEANPDLEVKIIECGPKPFNYTSGATKYYVTEK